MEKEDLRSEYMEIWDSLVPKILDLAQSGDNTGLAQFLDAHTYNEVSDGKLYRATCMLDLHAVHFVDFRNLLALGCLLYMAPDVRTKTDHTKVVTLLEVCCYLVGLY